MERLLLFMDGILRKVVTVVIGLMLLIIFIQVVLRYLFHFSFSFSEELARFLFVWTVFLCIPVVAREGGHMAVGAVTERLQGARLKVCKLTGAFLTLFFAGILFFQGIRMILLSRFQTSPALGVKMSYVYIAIPTGAGMLFLLTLWGTWKTLFFRDDTSNVVGG